MVRQKRGFCSALIVFALTALLSEPAHATEGDIFTKRLTETISKVRMGEAPGVRRRAAEHLFELPRGTNSKKVGDETIANIASLLDGDDDSVRYWVARCLGNFGPRAKTSEPKLQAVLAKVDCLQGSKTSASGIRFALAKMGITPSPPKCGTANE